MSYELKVSKSKHGNFNVCSAGILIVENGAVYMTIQSGDMLKLLFVCCYSALGRLVFLISCNNMRKCLTFNNVSFTFDGSTCTYQKINEIRTHGGRCGRVYYDIYADGK